MAEQQTRRVACVTAGCDYAGVERAVTDMRVSAGVVARLTLHCAACGNPLLPVAKVEASVTSPKDPALEAVRKVVPNG